MLLTRRTIAGDYMMSTIQTMMHLQDDGSEDNLGECWHNPSALFISDSFKRTTHMQYGISLQERPSLSQEWTSLNEPRHSWHPQLVHLHYQYSFDSLSIPFSCSQGYIYVTQQLTLVYGTYIRWLEFRILHSAFNLPLDLRPPHQKSKCSNKSLEAYYRSINDLLRFRVRLKRLPTSSEF